MLCSLGHNKKLKRVEKARKKICKFVLKNVGKYHKRKFVWHSVHPYTSLLFIIHAFCCVICWTDKMLFMKMNEYKKVNIFVGWMRRDGWTTTEK